MISLSILTTWRTSFCEILQPAFFRSTLVVGTEVSTSDGRNHSNSLIAQKRALVAGPCRDFVIQAGLDSVV